MPCYDGRERDADDHAYRAMSLLCALVKDLNLRDGRVANLSPELCEWLIEHERRDRERAK